MTLIFRASVGRGSRSRKRALGSPVAPYAMVAEALKLLHATALARPDPYGSAEVESAAGVAARPLVMIKDTFTPIWNVRWDRSSEMCMRMRRTMEVRRGSSIARALPSRPMATPPARSTRECDGQSHRGWP